MSKVLGLPLKNCENNYSVEELYDNFGMSDYETSICMKCKNCIIEDGIITCKYIVEGIESEK
jgi:hypothetical protein